MTYPYGTKGAPVVGNGLGGLPRRAVATAASAAVVSRRYDLSLIANGPTSFPTFQTNQRSVAIMLGGKIYKYYRTDFSPQVFRWSADYSATGYSNVTNTSTEPTSITQLPTVANPLEGNYCWSIEYSPTSGLFCYTNNRPFLVTVSGADTSYSFVNAPNSGTYENGGATWSSMTFFSNTAIISKNGQILMVGRDSSNRLALLRFDRQTLAFLGATTQATNAFVNANGSAQIFTTSYGYLVGCTSSTSGTGYLSLTSFDNDFFPISHARVDVSDGTGSGYSVVHYGVTVGQEGASGLFGDNVGQAGAVAGIYASPTGVISAGSNINTRTEMGSFTSSSLQGNQMKFIRNTQANVSTGNIDGTNIDGTIKSPFLSASPSFGNVFVPFSGSSYLHIDTKPVIENATPFRGYRSAETLCVKTGILMDNQSSPGICADNNGFVHIPNSYGGEGNQLFRRVLR